MEPPVDDTQNKTEAPPTQDELELSRVEDVIWSHRARLRSEPDFANSLSAAMSEWLAQLDRKKSGDTNNRRLSAVTATLAGVPPQQMDQLSSDLLQVASKRHKTDCANSALASLLAGWLKASAIEELGEETVRRAAHQVKNDYELFFERLLGGRRPER